MSGDRVDEREPQKPEEFDRWLIRALERVDAPAGFAARVTRCAFPRVAAPGVAAPGVKVSAMGSPLATPRARAWAGGALAAALALGVFVGAQVHLRHQREQAALANWQFETAVRVTGHALDQTRALLQRAGLNLDN